MDVETQIKIKYDIKARFHVATFMLWRVCAILKMFQSFDQITTITYVVMDNFLSLFLGMAERVEIMDVKQLSPMPTTKAIDIIY